MKEKTEHNIFWSGGFDSTFLVCKRLIVDELPIETYYLNFPCDGYDKTLKNDKNFLAGLNVYKGSVTYKAVADVFGHKYVSPNELF